VFNLFFVRKYASFCSSMQVTLSKQNILQYFNISYVDWVCFMQIEVKIWNEATS
jgi:hypothetical protein